tara:strand:- start:36 stop:812 length:777 start_codon:yes stop_codon:yes gene_type:complete
MQAVILAGGLGTRLSEETHLKPKPMVEIGGKPILWHLLKSYSLYGINEFIICCGYKGHIIKEYFSNYLLYNSDITVSLESQNIKMHQTNIEPWKITLVDTGEKTQTAGRLLRVKDYITEDLFCFTYGDGLSNVNINKLIESHNKSKSTVTLTAVQPPGRFGSLEIDNNLVKNFVEKPKGDNSRINGGFFVVNSKVFKFIEGDDSSWEFNILPELTQRIELNSYSHDGFWQPMDTLRDKNQLEEIYKKGNSPWLKKIDD